MLHTLLKQVKEYKLPSFLTPVAMIGEVICEMLIPRLMARIVDEGIYAGNMDVILQTGGLMILVAVAGLLCGIGGGFFGAKAAAGFAKNLRKEAKSDAARRLAEILIEVGA